MFKYALMIGGDRPIFYIEWLEKLHTNDVIEIKRNDVKFWKKDVKIINNFFLRNGKSEKSKDRDVNNYVVRVKIGAESGGRCLEDENATYEGFSAYPT